MTTGSWDRSSFTVAGAGFYGLKTTKTWSGTDRVKTLYTNDPPYVVKRWVEDERGRMRMQTLRFPKRNSFSKPPSRGEEIEHPYTASWTHWTDEPVTTSTGFTGPVMANFAVAVWAPVTLLGANDQIKLVEKLREKVLGSEFNFAVFIAELGPAMAMIADNASRIYKAVRAVKRGNIVTAAKHLVQGTERSARIPKPRKRAAVKLTEKDIANDWLQLQYGWLPLLKDVEAGAHFLAHAMSVPFKQTYRVSVRRESSTQTVTSTAGWPTGSSGITAKGTRIHRRHLKAILSEKPNVFNSLGLSNPESVAWELMPWSFVADWFIPIGQWMSARAFAQSLTGTFVTSDVMTGQRHSIPSVHFSPKNPRARWVSGSMTRTVSTTLDVPLPAFKPLSSVPSWTRLGNAISLLVQRVF